MYLSFYHLKHKPFQISTDPKFLWLGEKHEEALATLRYGVLDNKGFLLLTGDVGTGKTTLINALLKILGTETIVATVRDPDLEPMDFFHYISHAFGMPGTFTTKGAFLVEFEQFLHAAHTAKKRVLLIIDEAQRINQKLLEEVRLLSNIEREDKKLLNIFFVGQIEFNEILLRPENRPIRQRITVNYNIQPLTKNETDAYIQHRLNIAGTEDKLFEEEALKKIYSFSQGYPRLINIICDRCLLTGFVGEEKTISAAHVDECVGELSIPRFSHHKPAPPVPPSSASPPFEPAADTASADQPLNSASAADNKEKSFLPRNHLSLTLLLGLLIASSSLFFLFPDKFHSLKEYVAGLYITSTGEHTPPLAGNEKTIGTDKTDHKVQSSAPNNIKTNPPPPSPAQTNHDNEVSSTKRQEVVTNEKIQESRESISTNETVRDKPKFIDNLNNSVNKETETESQKQEYTQLINSNKIVIQFPSDSSFPEGNAIDELENLIVFLIKNNKYKISVNGYTDSYGNEPYNVKLSEFRAYSVKSYLVGKGLDATRINAQGFGSQNPIAPNETPAGRIANRRVEIELHE